MSHEYINLANAAKEDDDVYKIPMSSAEAGPPPVPPPPLPKRSLRASFVRRGANQRPNLQPHPQPQPRSAPHHYQQLPPQPKTAAPPPPASPNSEQHEYLNLWATAGEAEVSSGGGGGSGGGYSSELAPRNINDVPPLLPARPQRLRQQRSAGKHARSVSNSSSSSSSSSTNSSASPPGMGSGAVSEGKRAGLSGHYADLQLPPLSAMPTAPPPRRSSVSSRVPCARTLSLTHAASLSRTGTSLRAQR